MPWCGTMSFDTAGRTMMGFTSADLAALVETLDARPGLRGQLRRRRVGPSAHRAGLPRGGSERPVIAKGNAGIPKYVDGHIHYDGTPDLMARYAVLARDAGARIIGGCCGTQPDHLRKMRAALEETPSGDAPALEVIAAELGGFSSGSDGPGTMRAPRANVADAAAPGADDGHRMPNRKIALHHAYHERFFRVRAFAR
jgi:5-methyltetrahydrofolate--homocysteine methyltransferase